MSPPDVGPPLSLSLSRSLSVSLVLRPRVKYDVYTRAIADIIMARTLRTCLCVYARQVSLVHTGHTPWRR